MKNKYNLILSSLFSLFAIGLIGQSCEYDQSSLLFTLDDCKAIFGFPSQTEYTEFTAEADTFPGGTILSVVGGHLYRENGLVNMHSCTEGLDTTAAMCVSSLDTCLYIPDSDKAVRFDIKVETGDDGKGRLSGLSFYESAPPTFSWLNNGATGPNNYPTKYAIRVSIAGTTIFEEIDIETTSDFTLETFDFSGLPEFTVMEMTVFNFELLPYCTAGIESTVNAWDLENILITANAIDNVNGGDLTYGDGSIIKEICVGDEIADNMNVDLLGENGSNNYLITDGDSIIIFNDVSFPFDFDNNEGGVCLIWNISHYDEITGTDIGNYIGDIDGCFDLSNPITLIKNKVSGGVITGGPFEFCVGDNIDDNIAPGSIDLTGQEGDNGQWVITDDNNNIIGLPGNYADVNFDGADLGTCLIWYLSYNDMLVNLSMGNNLSDIEGCYQISNSITVIRNERPTVIVTPTATVCGENNGSATASGDAGIAPFTFSWSTGESGSNVSGLAPGSYIVTVTDANGCTNIEEFIIDDSLPLSFDTDINHTSCGEDNGNAAVNINNGTPPYNYEWSNGSSSVFISELEAGEYSVTVTDSNGCSDFATVIINDSSSPVASVSGTDTSCGEDNGTATVSATSGESPYTYVWSNGSTDSTISSLAAGTYSVTVTDSEGCTDETTVTIAVSSSPTVSVSGTDTTCGEDNGSATASTTSGESPYTYAWSNGSTGSTITGLAAGTYTVTVTDSEGCTDEATVTIDGSSSPTVSVSGTDTTCGEDNGSATASTTSGESPYTYAWSNGSTGSTITGLTASTYTVTVTDSEGCTDEETLTIEESISPSLGGTVFIDLNNDGCQAGAGDVIAGVTVTLSQCNANGTTTELGSTVTGADGSYEFGLNAAPDFICLDPDLTYQTSISNIPSGYNYSTGPGNGCVEDEDDSPLNNGVSICYNPTDDDAEDGDADEHIDFGFSPCPSLGGTVFEDLDNNGCQAGSENGVSGVTVTLLQCNANGTTTVLSSTETGADGSYEFGPNAGPDNVCLDPALTYQTSISNIPTGYNNSTGAGNGCVGDEDDSPLNDGVSTCYNPANDDGMDGDADEHIDFGVYPCPTISASAEGTTCGLDNGSASVSATGESGGFSFEWSNGSVGSMINNLSAGNYSVTLTDSGGCTATATVTVGDSSSPTVSTTSTGTTCGENNGTATATTNSGTAPYTYLWSNGSTSAMLDNLSAGTYTVTVTDSEGCTDSSSTIVDPSTSPIVSISGNDTSCGLDNGSATASTTSGESPYSYAWSNGSTGTTITGLSAGTYTVTVTDSEGCTDESSVSIMGSTSPSISVSGNDTSCGLDNGSATASTTSGESPYSYAWSNGSTGSTTTGLSAGTYTVTVTDSEGCTDETTVTIAGSTSPMVSISGNDTSCGLDNGSATVSATSGESPYSYEWSTGSTATMLTDLSAGTYTVTVTDSEGCTDETTVTIAGSTSPIVSISGNDTSCGLDNGSATVSTTSGESPYSYAWSTGSTTTTITDLSAGTYTVTVTDSEGCTDETTVTIAGSTSPIVSISGNDTSCGLDNGSATASTTSGLSPYSYEWSNGSTGSTTTGLSAGTYTVTVTDSEGCTDEMTVTIAGSTSPIPSIVLVSTTCGEDNGTVTVSTTSGISPYSYEWSTGSTATMLSGLAAGTYTVTVTDSEGCTETASTTVLGSTSPIPSITAIATTCGEDNGTATVSTTSGISPYSYEWSTGSTASMLTDLASGTYTVTVTDALGCAETATTEVGSSSAPSVNASPVATTCGEDNGSVTASTTSGTAPYTYVWSNGSTSSMLNNLSAGDYTVTVTDAAGCTDTATTTVDPSTSPEASATSFDTCCGEDNGSATASATSGIAPYTYSWSNGSSNSFVTGLSGGTYTVTVTDAAGCTSSASTDVSESSSPTASTTSTATTCGQDNGTATATAINGVQPYSYLWSNDETGEGASCANCIQTVFVPVGGIDPIIVEEVMVDGSVLVLPNYPYNLQDPLQAAQFLADCLELGYNVQEEYNPATGKVAISVLYPGQNFDSFNINGGQQFYFSCSECIGSDALSTSTITGLSAGTYTVTVTDSEGCSSISTTVVEGSTSPIASVSGTDTSCGEDNGTATVSATSGVSPYTYGWSTGSTSNMMSGLAAGTYTVTVTDSEGCTDESSVTIGDSSSPIASVSGTDTSCGEDNGTATVSATSGVSPYTYEWSTGSTSNMMSGLAAGTYTVTVTDSEGCTDESSVTIGESSSPIATTSTTDTSCGEDNGTATVSVTSGVSPYTYVWSTGSTSNMISGLATGTYTVTVTDSEGCTDEATAIVEGSSSPIASASGTDTSCGEDNGTATVSATSGVSPYTYEWSTGSTSNMMSGLTAGTYTVTVTDSEGCSDDSSITIDDSSSPIASASGTDTSCGEDNGTAAVSATSGVLPYTYLWSTGSTSNMMSGLAAGTYTVTVTDSEGCTDESSVTIGESSSPIATTSTTDTSCGEDNGTATVSVTSGVSPYTYLWSTGSTSNMMSGLATGTYTVTVTDSEGCTVEATAIVEGSSSPVASASGTDTRCGEDNGTATVSATSGVSPYTYEWSTGSTSNMMSGLAAGTYTVTITDSEGCTDESSVTIGDSSSPIASASGTDTSCGEDNGTATVSATSGISPYTYEWSTGSTSNMMSGLAAGTYTVTVTDSEGCTDESSITIGDSSSPIAMASATETNCGEDNGTATVSVTSGESPYTYEWSTGSASNMISGLATGTYTVTVTDSEGCTDEATAIVEGSSSPIASASGTDTSCGEDNGTATVSATSGVSPYTYEWSTGSTSNMMSGLAAGTYTVTVTDSEGCTDDSSVTIGDSSSPIANASGADTSCGEDNGTATVSATSGVSPYTYEWSTGSTSNMMSGLAAGTYTVTVTDSEGCTDESSVTIGDSSSPIAMASTTETNCGEDNGTATVSVTSGESPYTYLWSTGSTSNMISGLATGTYTVTVTDSEGCTDEAIAVVEGSSSPVASASGNDTSCGEDNGSATVSATIGVSPYTYLWSTGSTSNMVSGLAAGTYTVTVTDSEGCTDESSVTIGDSSSPIASVSGNDTSCGEDNGTATVSATSGVSPYTYEWSTGSTSNMMSGLAAGTYTVTVTDSEGCTDESSVTIGDSSSPIASVSGTDTSCGEDNGSATVSATSGVSPYTYEWSTGSTSNTMSGLAAGTYAVTVTDSEGCTDESSVTIGDSSSPIASVSENDTSCGEDNGSATVSATSGVSPYTYEWSTGSTSNMMSGLAAGTYTVTVTDSEGCTDESSVTIGDSSSPIASVSGNDTSCGEDNGTATVSATSGVSPYTYEWSTGSTSNMMSGLAAGTYTVTVTDSEGCTDESSVTIGDSSSPIASVSGNDTSCGEDNGTATVSATSGVSPYTYEWSTGSTSNTMSGLAAGTYTVTVTDSEECTDEASVTIESSNSPVIIIAAGTTTCGENNGSALVLVSSGVAPYTYLWSNGGTTNTIENLEAGLYTVTVTDNEGCTAVGSETIGSSSSPVLSIDSQSTTCGENNGTASATATEGMAPYEYVWSTGATTSSLSGLMAGSYSVTVTDSNGCTAVNSIAIENSQSITAATVGIATTCGEDNGVAKVDAEGTAPYEYIWSNGANTQTIIQLEQGEYTVTVTDSEGCTAVASVLIEDSSSPVLYTGSNPEICGLMNGDVTVGVTSGGIAPYTYLWSNGSTEATQMGLDGGTYTVTVTDSEGCSSSAEVEVEGSTAPEGGSISVDGETSVEFCQEGTMDMFTNLMLSGEDGQNMIWVITNEDGEILNLLTDSEIAAFDFENQDLGTCFVYHLSYYDIENLISGNNIIDLSGCYDFSNSIEVTKYEIVGFSESSLVIDMEMCASNSTTDEPADYSEFTADINNDSNCTTLSVVGGNLYRENPTLNGHSCTVGVDGSVAMCVSSEESCEYNPDSEKKVILEVEVEPSTNGSSRLSELSFFEKAPLEFDWLDGPSGLNNYPTLFGVRILKGSDVVFQESGISTLQEWNERTFELEGDDFLITETTTFTIELLPYCVVGNESTVTAWDIDNLSILSECDNTLEGGTLSGGPYVICKDGIPDYITDITLEGAVGDMVKLVLVDESNNVITHVFDDLAEFSLFDFETIPDGLCNLYAISTLTGLTGCEVGNILKIDFEGCYKLSNPVSIEKMSCGTLISTYPNPTSANITISNIHSMEGYKKIYVFDGLGQIVKELSADNTILNMEVDLSEMNPGLYTIQIIGARGEKATSTVMKIR